MNKPFNTQELCGKLDKARGYNMNTCSGKPVWPQSPRAEDIRIDDIAGALSRVCRFGGHLKDKVYLGEEKLLDTDGTPFSIPRYGASEIYSVAQHSVLVEQYVRASLNAAVGKRFYITEDVDALLLAALLHDAHEYILGDMIKPQKKMYSQRNRYELEWDDRIAERFGFSADLFDHPAIKKADYRIFLTEKRDLVKEGETNFGKAKAEPYPERIIPVLPSAARKMFMDRFNELYQGE